MEAFLASPIFWVVVTAASEIIGMSKLKENSVIQLAIATLFDLKRNVQNSREVRSSATTRSADIGSQDNAPSSYED